MTNARRTPVVWLCDLTYTQQTVSSDVMPAAVGHIASYTRQYFSGDVDIRLFKFPEKLAAALEAGERPDVIGFSNYIWNLSLSAAFAALIKKHAPGVVTVMGGPNYPTTAAEQEEFLRAHTMIDFYVVKEGELAFAKLVETLAAEEFDPARVPADLPSLHRIQHDGTFVAAALEDRITDLAAIPSPYLEGLMDEYFDGLMLPIIQTNRGCPFRCTFCVEGSGYYSRVAKARDRKIYDELEYIASRMAGLREEGRSRSDLHIADSNFGMYKEDLDICRHIATLQERYGYPEYINVATGKNHKERVLEAANLINGALRLSGSVQSLDKGVLENIDRSNIDEQEIIELALSASEIDANSYSEIILGLPGDTREAHLRTIRSIVEADFNTIALYQLMLLPGTDLASADSVRKWDMVNKYRVLPRCFGHWNVLGEQINVAEIEEICVANDSLTFEDYLDCRHMHLIINVFYNDGVFKEVLRLLRMIGVPVYAWLERIWRHRENERFNAFVEDFLGETENELWDSRAELRAFVDDEDAIERYIDGELGANLIFKYRSLALIRHTADLAEVARSTLAETLREAGAGDEAVDFGNELIEFARLRMTDIFRNRDHEITGRFDYDVLGFAHSHRVSGTAADFRCAAPQVLAFDLSAEQKRTIEDFIDIYGSSVMGLSRILSKVYMRRLFRVPQAENADPELSRKDVIVGEGQLTGLNEFA